MALCVISAARRPDTLWFTYVGSDVAIPLDMQFVWKEYRAENAATEDIRWKTGVKLCTFSVPGCCRSIQGHYFFNQSTDFGSWNTCLYTTNEIWLALLSAPCFWGDRCFLFSVSCAHRSCANICGSQWRVWKPVEDPPLSSVLHEPGPERHQGWDYLTASGLRKHMDVWQVVIASYWNSDGWKDASVLIYCIIYRLACWAKENTQQLSHLDLNFCLLL